MKRSIACIVPVLALVVTVTSAAARRPVAETDILRYTWVADPQISPDGTQIAFVLVTVNAEKDRYESALYVVPADGSAAPRPFTSGPFDTSPRWSPDGRWLAFVRGFEKAESEKEPRAAQIHLLSTGGGEARALTGLPKGAGSPAWSPDGRTLLFTSTTLPEDFEKKDPKEKRSDVRVVTRAVYRFNGPGYLDPERASHIWTVPATPGDTLSAPVQITSGAFGESDPAWSPDGARIYFTSTRVLEPYYEPYDEDLFAVPAAGGDIVTVADIDGSIGEFALSPDGKHVAFVGSVHARPVRSYNQPDLFVTGTAPGSTPRNLTAAYDFDINSGVSADQHPPRGGAGAGILWSHDGKSVLVRAAVHGRANLMRARVSDGGIEPFTSGDHEVVSHSASADHARVAILISSATAIGDIHVANMRTKKNAPLKQVTNVNAAMFDSLAVPAPEEFWYASFDGRQVHGWILKPNDFDPARKYPMILQIHGGPHIPYGYAFTHEFLWMAAKGYVVVYTNPRGSTSYGQEFGNLIQHAYPGDDHKDLMAAVDEVLKRGYVDEKKLGVTGGSGGGILTNWAITQTDRFAAAVSQRSIADWYGFWFTCDFTLFQPYWFRGAPWEDPADYAARSPITHVAKINTPLMLVEGENDMRTPPADGGEIMFRALKYLKKPVVMVRFPGETHELSRSGQPRHRIERLQHIVGWFDKYLQGKETDAYDVR